jgi:DNA-binding response OmpR family regulator
MTKRKKVLVVDDSLLLLEVAKDALDAAGFETLTASELGEMEFLREREQPDLILMDVQMPEAFGDDVASVLREVRQVKVPVVLFSNIAEAELAERARAAELAGYVCKGAGIEAMVARVKSLLEDT